MISSRARVRNVNIAALDFVFREKVKSMMDLFTEATEIRKELIAAGIHVKFLRGAGIIAFSRHIDSPVAVNEIIIEEPKNDENS